MAKKDLKTRVVVWVRWNDSSYQGSGWWREDELKPKCVLETAGLFIREDKDSVLLALDFDEADRTWQHIVHIPKVNIIQMKKLRF